MTSPPFFFVILQAALYNPTPPPHPPTHTDRRKTKQKGNRVEKDMQPPQIQSVGGYCYRDAHI